MQEERRNVLKETIYHLVITGNVLCDALVLYAQNIYKSSYETVAGSKRAFVIRNT